MERRKIKPEYYLGEAIRDVCPSLYGKPIHDEQGRFIPYVVVIPKISPDKVPINRDKVVIKEE